MRLRREVSAAPAACCRNRHQRSDPAIHAGGCRYRRPALSMSGPEASHHTSHNCSDPAASTGGHGGYCRYQRPAIQTEASTLPKYVIQPSMRLCQTASTLPAVPVVIMTAWRPVRYECCGVGLWCGLQRSGTMSDEQNDWDEQLRRAELAEYERKFPPIPRASAAPDNHETESAASDPTPAPTTRRKSRTSSAAPEFTGTLAPIQLKLPADLIQSLRLAAIDQNETMSAVVLRCLTSPDVVTKMWVSSRRTA